MAPIGVPNGDGRNGKIIKRQFFTFDGRAKMFKNNLCFFKHKP